MSCDQCKCPFEPTGIQLIREEDGLYIVSIYCHQCQQQIGVAMVGVETRDVHVNDAMMHEEPEAAKFPHALYGGTPTLRQSHSGAHHRYAAYDPELTPSERRRLAAFAPITEDDVMDAHQFFKNLDASWSAYLTHAKKPSIKPDLREKTDSETAVQNAFEG
ncbi:MAG: hypothetical protein VKK59_07565 [Vampirovibrionales bacterium]|nr:hypothetical protein [Vampirovibrionales bacterium]